MSSRATTPPDGRRRQRCVAPSRAAWPSPPSPSRWDSWPGTPRGTSVQREQARFVALSETSRAPTVETLTTVRPPLSSTSLPAKARRWSGAGGAPGTSASWTAPPAPRLRRFDMGDPRRGGAARAQADTAGLADVVSHQRHHPGDARRVRSHRIDGGVRGRGGRAAEVWVDGRRARPPGTRTPASRAIVTRQARPGQRIQLAILGINLPSSEPSRGRRASARRRSTSSRLCRRRAPAWARWYGSAPASTPSFRPGRGSTRSPTGFERSRARSRCPRATCSSATSARTRSPLIAGRRRVDVPAQSGYAGVDIREYQLPGSNGLALDAEGRLTVTEHGRRRVSGWRRAERSRSSPSDTTAPPQQPQRPRLQVRRRSLFHGPALRAARPSRRSTTGAGLQRHLRPGRRPAAAPGADLPGPNGLAFSPNERYLYVMNSDDARSAVMRYDVNADGTLARGHVFFTGRGDGVKVDRQGTSTWPDRQASRSSHRRDSTSNAQAAGICEQPRLGRSRPTGALHHRQDGTVPRSAPGCRGRTVKRHDERLKARER